MMRQRFTFEYWIEDGWYPGRLKEAHGVFFQCENYALYSLAPCEE